MNGDKINGVGVLFRFITPSLIIILGTVMIMILSDVKRDVEKLDNHFTNHLSHHLSLETGLKSRLARIEALLKR